VRSKAVSYTALALPITLDLFKNRRKEIYSRRDLVE